MRWRLSVLWKTLLFFTHSVLNVEGDPRPGRRRFAEIWKIFHIAHPRTGRHRKSGEASSDLQTKSDADVSISARNTDYWQKLITAAQMRHFQFYFFLFFVRVSCTSGGDLTVTCQFNHHYAFVSRWDAGIITTKASPRSVLSPTKLQTG